MDRICLFCAPEPSRLLVSEDLVLALRDGYPVSRGHALIVSRRHVGSFGEVTLQEQAAMLAMLCRVRALLNDELRPDGYNIGINDGAAAGQTFMHVHMHVIPRYRGDRPDPRGGIRWIVPEVHRAVLASRGALQCRRRRACRARSKQWPPGRGRDAHRG